MTILTLFSALVVTMLSTGQKIIILWLWPGNSGESVRVRKKEDGRYNALCSTEKSNSSGMMRYPLNLLRAKSNFKVTFPEINGSAEV